MALLDKNSKKKNPSIFSHRMMQTHANEKLQLGDILELANLIVEFRVVFTFRDSYPLVVCHKDLAILVILKLSSYYRFWPVLDNISQIVIMIGWKFVAFLDFVVSFSSAKNYASSLEVLQ